MEWQLHQRAAEAQRSQQVQFEQLAKNLNAGQVYVIDESAVVRHRSCGASLRRRASSLKGA